VECAPGQIADATLAAFLAVGVNRVSMGVQSFVDREAQLSGRLDTRPIVERDVERLRAAGIANLNLDLIAGLAEQTFASWEESLTALIGLNAPHASVYMLEVDEDSRLGREMLGGGGRYHAGLVPTDEAIAQMYTRAVERMGEAGLAHYEISNFFKPGFASKHNLRYWQRRPYLGLGLDASSMALHAADALPALKPLGAETCVPSQALRWTTTDDLTAYLAGPQPVETAWHSPARQHEEAWFLGLRLNAGVEPAVLEREFGPELVAAALEVVERLAGDGLMEFEGNAVRLTARGRMVSNDVFQEFLGLDAAPLGAEASLDARALQPACD
jgi:oxygen-independent coproporphyrinogen-3 oxidase